jgi:hypothetical protein
VPLPSYSPETNPAERVFEEARRQIEEEVYEFPDGKQAEAYLNELAADPERVKGLCGGQRIREALTNLPPQAA